MKLASYGITGRARVLRNGRELLVAREKEEMDLILIAEAGDRFLT